MSTKHTPGPWVALEIDEGIHAFSVSCARDPIGTRALDVCAVWRRGGDAKAEANARLIAAAPELLEALCDMVAATQGKFGDLPFMAQASQKAADAIAKATGA